MNKLPKWLLSCLTALALGCSSIAAHADDTAFELAANVDTVHLAVTGTAQSLTLPVITAGKRQLIVNVIGTQTVFYRHDGTTSTVNNAMPLTPGIPYLITASADKSAASLIAATTGSTIYITAGQGR